MTKLNSVVGCGYIPRNVQAVCLKTKNNASLGEVEYEIISELYERKFQPSGMYAAIISSKPIARMAVNLLDKNTGLTYAAEYEPANLVRTTPKSGTDKPEENVDLIARVEQINEELKGIFEKEGVADKCGVVLFAVSDDNNGKTATGATLVAGRGSRIVNCVSSACADNPKILELIQHGTMEAMLRRAFGKK